MYKDRQMQQSVLEELSSEPRIVAAHIDVTAKAGVVTLSGHVESYAEKYAAEAAAQRVEGVKSVAAEIEVRLPFNTQRGDDEIAAAAIESLAWDVSIPADAIDVKVLNGLIILTGTVYRSYQSEAAEQDVRRLFGVVGVSNRITIRRQADVSNISDHLTPALQRSWHSARAERYLCRLIQARLENDRRRNGT